MSTLEKEAISAIRLKDKAGLVPGIMAVVKAMEIEADRRRERLITIATTLTLFMAVLCAGYSLGASLGQPPQWVMVNAIWGGVAGLFSALIAVYLWHYLKILRELKYTF